MPRGIRLDVDPTIIDNQLLLNKNADGDNELESLLNNVAPWRADLKDGEKVDVSPHCKLVKPMPGICIKAWKDTGDKFFINVCHTEHIPEPPNTSDYNVAELINFANDTDSVSDNPDLAAFRIPMSIGNIHSERDKGGQPCEVCDVAINTNFFNNKILTNEDIKHVLMTIVVEGVMDKYNVDIDRDKTPIILKHCRFMGKIESQMVQVRQVNTSKETSVNVTSNKEGNKRPLIEEINDKCGTKGESKKTEKNALIEACPYRLLVDDQSIGLPDVITANVFIKRSGVNDSKNITLDVGEDRLVLRTANRSSNDLNDSDDCNKEQVLLDIFLPYNVKREACVAHFNTDNKVLTVEMPVVSA